jgi:hypothetical protein
VDNLRLRIRLGENEFEAEGASEEITRRWDTFARFLPPDREDRGAARVDGARDDGWAFHDEGPGRPLTLRVIPPAGAGRLRQIGDMMILLLHAQNRLRRRDTLTVLEMSEGLRLSGFSKLKRLSTSFAYLEREGLAMKSGRGKGTTYRPTERGLDKARAILDDLRRKTES